MATFGFSTIEVKLTQNEFGELLFFCFLFACLFVCLFVCFLLRGNAKGVVRWLPLGVIS